MATPANSTAALSQLQKIQSTAQDPNTILSGQRQQLGVNAAQDTVTGLRGAINNTTQLLKQVAPSVMGRTGNSLVTSAQAGRIIQNEQAPISQNLTDQGTQYTQATGDLSNLENRASQAANGIYQGQQDKLSYAQNLYNTLYQKEKDAQTAAEQTRQFNEQLSASKKAASGGAASYLSGGSVPTAATAPKAASTQRSDGGFNFTDTSGAPISAAKYAQLTGQNVLNVLLKMGQAGDKFAAQTYNTMKQAPGVASRPQSLFWGT